MIDLLPLVKQTSAYNVIMQDKANGRLSHAYLVTCADADFLGEYLKILAKLIVCEDLEPCNNCRACNLIQKNAYADVSFYPTEGDAVLVQDISAIIEASCIKPLEGDKRVFVINKGQGMNAVAQNKLLKTLEEPPLGVHILIGTTSEYAMLSTVKSRCKKVQIQAFSNQTLMQVLAGECQDQQTLQSAVACSDGTLGRAKALLNDQSLKTVTDLVCDVLVNMRSSKDVLAFSEKITKAKIDFSQFITVTELFLRDLLCIKTGKPNLVLNPIVASLIANEPGYNKGAIVYVLDKITDAKKRKKFNANQTMLTDWLLFTILEGKFKWQKL